MSSNVQKRLRTRSSKSKKQTQMSITSSSIAEVDVISMLVKTLKERLADFHITIEQKRAELTALEAGIVVNKAHNDTLEARNSELSAFIDIYNRNHSAPIYLSDELKRLDIDNKKLLADNKRLSDTNIELLTELEKYKNLAKEVI